MNKIVEIAKSFEGQKELKGNSGFVDAEFEEKMKATGWNKGEAWCSYFTELVARLYFTHKWDKEIAEDLDTIFSGSAVATYSNFKKDKRFKVNKTPKEGAVVIYQTYRNGKPFWTGHAAIVTEVNEDHMMTIEGNTDSEGGREGVEVAVKKRPLGNISSTLRLKGFIHLI